MRYFKSFITAMLLFAISFGIFAQNTAGVETVAVLNIDTKGVAITPAQAEDITWGEMDKLQLFCMIDKEEVNYWVNRYKLGLNNCFSKICLVEIGRAIGLSKVLTGSVVLNEGIVVVTFHLIDVGTADIVKTEMMEFLNERNQEPTMIGITLKKMFGVVDDTDMLTQHN